MPNIAETPVPKDLSELVDVLSEEMGPHGLDTLADVDRIQQIMANYESNASDWNQYALFDEGRYTRNLVSAGNGKFNLMVSVWLIQVLCWSQNQASPIHDHSNSHCIVKMLDGELTESLYDWPTENTGHLDPRKESTFHKSIVCWPRWSDIYARQNWSPPNGKQIGQQRRYFAAPLLAAIWNLQNFLREGKGY